MGKDDVVIDLSGDDSEIAEVPQVLVSRWTPSDVSAWLCRIGYNEYSTCVMKTENPISGQKLLSLTREDLKEAPFFMQDRTERDNLQTFIEKLRGNELSQHIKTLDRKEINRPYYFNKNSSQPFQSNGRNKNGFAPGSEENQDFTNVRTPLISVLCQVSNPFKFGNNKVHLSKKRSRSTHTKSHSWPSVFTDFRLSQLKGDDALPTHLSSELYPPEKMKSLIAFGYLLTGFLVSVITLQLVHERVPPKEDEPPLPDIFFDIVPVRFEKAFNVCEVIGLFLSCLAILVAVFHRHRYIVFRRIGFIIGTLYLYRSCTMYVTTLPVPGLHFKCAPKAHGQISLMISRAFGLLIGGGLTVTGSHHLCGDYLFSGHTLVLVVSYLVIYEYTPRRMWYLHWTCWILSCTGILCILLAHDHYTVDIVVAYILTSRLFYTYHTLANNQTLKNGGNSNLLARCWWFPIFRYFEGNIRSNGPLPRKYEWPLPYPKSFRSDSLPVRRSPIKGV